MSAKEKGEPRNKCWRDKIAPLVAATATPRETRVCML
jgi:hypothetical protein